MNIKKKTINWLTYRFALPIIRKYAKDSNVIEHYRREGGKEQDIIDLLSMFYTQGHSGMSAPIAARIFNNAVNFRILSPLKFTDEEWGKSLSYKEDSYQNSRMSSVFKENNKIYDIDAMTFIEKSGYRFDMSINNIVECEYASKGYGFHGGGIVVYDDVNDVWGVIGSRHNIINKKTFMGKNQVNVPVIEIYDSNDTKNDFFCNFTLLSLIPNNFFNDYELTYKNLYDSEDMINYCKAYKNILTFTVKNNAI